MHYLVERVAVFWRRLFGRPPLRAVVVEDLPERPRANTVYIVGAADDPWLAALVCPCGCGEVIKCPLVRLAGPRWTVEVTGELPTLRPSIWRTAGCRSHFFVVRGRIKWVTR